MKLGPLATIATLFAAIAGIFAQVICPHDIKPITSRPLTSLETERISGSKGSLRPFTLALLSGDLDFSLLLANKAWDIQEEGTWSKSSNNQTTTSNSTGSFSSLSSVNELSIPLTP